MKYLYKLDFSEFVIEFREPTRQYNQLGRHLNFNLQCTLRKTSKYNNTGGSKLFDRKNAFMVLQNIF